MDAHPFGWLSVLPPIVAFGCAVVTRQIVVSLVVGVLAGALILTGGDPLAAIYQAWEVHLWATFTAPSKLRVFSFTILMGATVGVMIASGGMQDLVDRVACFARNRRRSQLVT